MSEALRSFFKSIQQLSVKKNRDVYKKKTTLYYFGRFKRRTRFFSRCSRRNEVLFCFAICMTAAFNSCSKCSTRSCYQPIGASTLEPLNLLKKKKDIIFGISIVSMPLDDAARRSIIFSEFPRQIELSSRVR